MNGQETLLILSHLMGRGIRPTSPSAYCWLVPSLAELFEGQGPSLPRWYLLEPQPLASLLGPRVSSPVFVWSWGSAGQATWPFAHQLQCDLGRSLASLAWGSHSTAEKLGFPGRQGRPEAQLQAHLPHSTYPISMFSSSHHFWILFGQSSTLNTNQDHPHQYPQD